MPENKLAGQQRTLSLSVDFKVPVATSHCFSVDAQDGFHVFGSDSRIPHRKALEEKCHTTRRSYKQICRHRTSPRDR